KGNTVKEKAVQLVVHQDIMDYYGKDYSGSPKKMGEGTKKFNAVSIVAAGVFGTSTQVKNYYIFGEKGKTIESATALNVDYYNEYLETQECKNLQEMKENFMWTGYHTFIDESVGLSSDAYAVSLTMYSNLPKLFIICDIRMETIQEILNSIDLGEGSILGFVTADGREILQDTTISQPLFTELEAYKQAVLSNEEDIFNEDIKYDGKDYCFVYSKVGTTGTVFCGLVPRAVLLQDANTIGYVTLAIVIIAVMIAMAIGTYISTGIGKTIRRMNKGLEQASSGDLTVKFSTNRKDEFLTLSDSMNHMVKNTHQLIEEASGVNGKIMSSSQNVSGIIQEMVNMTQNISVSVTEVERGCVQQAGDIEQCATYMNILSEGISEVHESIGAIEKISDEAKEAIEQGVVIVNQLNSKMSATSEITNVVIGGIEELEKNSRSIDTIVNVINELSSQTNLLSLNASIEAARAGSAGRGFTVVADEIRKLADLTMSAGRDISKLIADIQDKTKDTARFAEQAGEIVRSQTEALDGTIHLFTTINDSVVHLTKSLGDMVIRIDKMMKIKEESMDRISNVAAISQESAAVAEEVNATTGNQMQMMEELATEAGKLKEDIHELEVAIQKFVVC
ncbi:MAG: methyl-accepting chemotaxis protein, partial [Clostridiales bacterium]|nr:methyl-accepting chemotaxis protein [Clostridiales bacterium]